jgi:hypothetical protein
VQQTNLPRFAKYSTNRWRSAVGDVVQLRSPIDLNTDLGRTFVVDATGAAEGLLTDQELQEAYELTPADWIAITKDTALGRAIRDERARRVRNGTAARESAARHFVKAPTILAGIMENQASNPRHVIEAAKEIRAVAAGGATDHPSQTEKFMIVLNLGSDHIERHEVDITPKPQVDLERDDGDQWG